MKLRVNKRTLSGMESVCSLSTASTERARIGITKHVTCSVSKITRILDKAGLGRYVLRCLNILTLHPTLCPFL